MDMGNMLSGRGPAGVIPAMSEAYTFGENVASAGQRAETQALNLDVARRTKKEYEDAHSPVYFDDIGNKIPMAMQPGMMKLFQATGNMRMDGNRPYAYKKDVKEFLMDFKKNDVAQSMVLENAREHYKAATSEMQKILDAKKPEIDQLTLERDQKIEKEMAKVSGQVDVKGNPILPNSDALKKINDEWGIKQRTHPTFLEVAKIQKRMYEIAKESDDLLTDTGVKNEKYEANAKHFNSREIALKIALGQTTAEAEERKMVRMKAEARKDMLLELEALKTTGRKDLQEMKGDTAEAISMNRLAAAKEKELKIAELDKMDEMVERAVGKDGDKTPTKNQISVIRSMARKFGKDFKEVDKVVPGTWGRDDKTIKVWELTDEGGQAATAPSKAEAPVAADLSKSVIPAEGLAQLKLRKGARTKFKNNQVWILEKGIPKRIE